MRGLDIGPDGTLISRTDTYGTYLWNGSQWVQLVTAYSMPSAFVTEGNSGGVYEIRVAPSNTNVFYMSYNGYVFVSNDRGSAWTQTGFASVGASNMNANDAYGQYGQKLAVDPANSNVVYAGSENEPLFVTTNGGGAWQAVSGIPSSVQGFTGITFDASSGTTNGITNVIYLCSNGSGVYRSSNAGAAWTILGGGPTTVHNAAISTSGVYFAVDGSSIWAYKANAWVKLYSFSNGIQSVAVNPSNASVVVAQSPAGYMMVSTDEGQTWTESWNSNEVSSLDIPWIAQANTASNGGAVYMDTGGLVFNPLVADSLIASAGTGVWTAVLPQTFTANSSVVWTDQSIGIEQLVANDIVVPPGGVPVLASWDRPFFYIGNPNQYPSAYGPVNSVNIVAGWSVDYASSSPAFLVGVADWWGTEQTGYSLDFGQTWNTFASIPSFGANYLGGTIAASSPSNIIWAPANGYQPFYTTNGGSTWSPVNLPGVSSWTGFDTGYYLDTRTVTADRVLANTFYLFYGGVFQTINGGATWTEVYTGDITPFDYYNAKLLAVPGQAGHLFFTGGSQSGTQPANEPFMRSTNGGATWTAVPNVLEVLSFGFGAPKTTGGYPAIFIAGWVNNVYGIFQSDDQAQTWAQIGTWPLGSLDQIKTVAGDPNTHGVAYVGFSGSGYAYYGP